MNKYIKFPIMLIAGASLLASCLRTPEFRTTDKGPDMTVNSCTEATYMGAGIKFSVTVNDDEFALSTLKAKLFYDEAEVGETVVRTKENGTYEGTLTAPLYKDIPDGIASVVFAAQNVGMGLTYDTVYVSLKRPDFPTLTLSDQDGGTWQMHRKEGWRYEVTADFPARMKGIVTTPAVNADGDVITFGWNGSELEAGNENTIPFSANISGEYTVSVDLMSLSASPFNHVISEEIDLGEASPEAVFALRQGTGLSFPLIEAVSDWDLDPDFFSVDDNKNVIFNAVDGYYKFRADFGASFIKVLPCDAAGNELSMGSNCDGAVWAIGQNFGKPVIGPSWNTTDGAYAFAQVSPKVFQFSLNVGGQIKEGVALKIFQQMGWGGEFAKKNFASFDGAGVFVMTESGDINIAEGAKLADKKAYRFTLDLNGGADAAVLKVREVEAAGGAVLDISVNGVKADRLSKSIYKIKAMQIEKGAAVSFSGIDNPDGWYADPDHFSRSASGLSFNAVSGYYSMELNLDGEYLTVRRVKADGSPATFKDEGAVTIMGWGVAHPVMTSQLAWDSGALITMAEVEDGVYQFTGTAVEETDGQTMGGRFRYDYLSVKFFGQAGWGDEMGTVTLTDSAAKLLKAPGNIELAEGAELEKGAVYVMTVTADNSGFSGGKFDCTVDFVKK